MAQKKHSPGIRRVKINSGKSMFLYLSKSTCWDENQVTKDQINVKGKPDVGAFGMQEKYTLSWILWKARLFYCVDNPGKAVEVDNRGS